MVLLRAGLIFLLTMLVFSVQTARAENAALAFVNQVRQASHLPPFKINRELERAAGNHVGYMAHYNVSDHGEHSGSTGFTGATCLERVRHTGYAAAMCLENNSAGQKNWSESAQGLMSAIYHRIGFLGFDIDEIGFSTRSQDHGAEKGRNFFSYVMGSSVRREMCQGRSAKYGYQACNDNKFIVDSVVFERRINELAANSPEHIVYPFPNQQAVPPYFRNTETPNPLPGVEVSGQPISVHFNAVKMRGKHVSVTGLRLTDSHGRAIELLPEKNGQNDPHLSEQDYVWFPRLPLAWSSQYKARLDYTVEGQSLSREWTFTTAAPPVSMSQKREGVIVIDHTNKKIRVKNGRVYSLVLSPALSQSYLNSVSTSTVGDVKFEPEILNVLSLSLRGRTTLTFEMNNGQRITVYASSY
ncbi:CAP domain-containing protein [Parendozoicomonas haliclonae]|uniref:SCP domain-containing protein n=1 Tax=Parendozoicomonas haliclonae TaxID=1960125 RepID=A0A1X7AN66_9GAMM|nr:CAP domain-containing protein [Parendozoicomonas haliclonae]SMA49528.1 hypothetical protein EHSB41UT_03320 [Parendozoicomonas haliclonae]